jgi:signal transduction histidine kinase/ligand-binding sensor domain-containing protein
MPDIRLLRFIYRVWLSAALFLLTAVTSGATISLSQWPFDHTRWMGRNGAPARSECFAQTPDGFLWIGSPEGLYRFDGLSFEQFKPLSGSPFLSDDIATLYVSREGDLWVGDRGGGASRIRKGMVTRFEIGQGLAPTASVLHFVQDSDGTMWAATWVGLYRMVNDRWQKIGEDWGYTGHIAQEVGLDADGTLWVLSGEEIDYLPRGAHRFQTAGPQASGAGFVHGPDGLIVLNDKPLDFSGGISHVQPFINGSVFGGKTAAYLFDRSNGLWVISAGEGVYRIPHSGRTIEKLSRGAAGIERFTQADGLSSALIYSVFEDREGNIWVGTETGVDRFTPTHFEALSTPNGSTNQTLVPGEKNSVYLTSYNSPTLRIDQSGVATVFPEAGADITASYRDSQGGLWFGSRFGLEHVEDGRVNHFALPNKVRRPVDDILSLAMDKSGELWVSIAHEGIFRFNGKTWSQVLNPFDPAPIAPSAVFCDRGGTIWLGYEDHVVEILPDRKLSLERRDVSIGTIHTFAEGEDGTIWAGGDKGLAFRKGEMFHAVCVSEERRVNRVKGLLFSSSGDLWANGNPGLIRIEAPELVKLVSDPNYNPKYEVFDVMAQVTGRTPPAGGAIRDDSGNLWFGVSDKTFRLRKGAQPRSPTLPPKTEIRSLVADNVPYANDGVVTLPPGTRSLRVAYTAMTLVASDEITFRYRLEGLDQGWQNANNVREVTYMSLPPGSYRFEVSAKRPGGDWDQGSSIRIHVEPSFTQTRVFLILCLLAVGSLIWLLWRLRLRQLQAVFQIRSSAQVLERTRIARELHDTLLQGVQGLTLRLGYVLKKVASDTALHKDLEDTIERTESMLLEGRRRVRDLRGGMLSDGIVPALEQSGATLAATHHLKYLQSEEGKQRRLDRIIQEEIFGIAREALTNAFQHSGGTQVSLRLIFEPRTLILEISDDGIGIDNAAVEQASANGHWGIRGMQERAAGVGASLRFEKRIPSGTVVHFRIPGKVAYRKNYGEDS